MISAEYVRERYAIDLANVELIASECGCGIANIRRILKVNEITRGNSAIEAGNTKIWNRGKTKNDDARLKKFSDDQTGESNVMFGLDSWNKGLTKDTDPRMKVVSEKLIGRGFSEEHKRKLADAKTGLRLEDTNRWGNGESISNGYATKNDKDGKDYLHRKLAEGALGRALGSEVDVHHIDMNKLNNSPINLLVMSGSIHSRLHRHMKKTGLLSKSDQIDWLTSNRFEFEALV